MKSWLFIAVVAFLLAGCQGMYTGGGWLVADDQEGGKAHFGFNAQDCGDGIEGQFNYIDKNEDPAVKMNGEVIGAERCYTCGRLCKYVAVVDYRNTNPKAAGDGGIAVVCASDNGEGVNAYKPDKFTVFVKTGPFAGYSKSGDVQGNIQSHECEEEDF